MEVHEALFSKVLATIQADSTGLNGSGSTSFVRQIYRYGDVADLKDADRPYIEVNISSRDISPCPNGAATSGTNEAFDNTVTFVIGGDRDENAGLPTIDRVEARLLAVFQYTAMSNLVDTDDGTRTWAFSPMVRLLSTQGSLVTTPMGKITEKHLSFRVLTSKGTT